MKKLTFALMCALSVLLMVSCSKNEETPSLPTIEFVNAGENYVYQNTEIAPGDMVGIQVKAIATDSKDLLTSLELKINWQYLVFDTLIADTTITLDKLTTYTFNVEPEEMLIPDGSIVTIEAIVKTQKSQQASAKVVVTIVDPTLEVNDLTWVREGSAAATGLEQFGLKWEANYKGVCAKIVPVEGALLGKVEDFTFDEVTTENEKAAAYLTSEALEEFHEISCEIAGPIDHLLITYYNDNYYLIHLTKTTINVTAAGTNVTITGQWK